MQIQALKLEDPAAIPVSIRSELAGYRDLFEANESIEEAARWGVLRHICERLEVHLRAQRIHGYHCTKEPAPGHFAKHGLRATNVAQQHTDFLAMHGHHFTDVEIAEIRRRWADWFAHDQQRLGREGMVWACLSRSLVRTSGTERFFRYFGGEVVYMPLTGDGSIFEAKLADIGAPMVVEVSIPGAEMNTCMLGLCALGEYHVGIRNDARTHEVECFIRRDLLPEEVISVTPLDLFAQ